MKFYTNVQRYKQEILYRGVENGKRVFRRERYRPTLYVKDPNSTYNFTTIYGEKVRPMEFPNMYEAGRFLKENQFDDYISGSSNWVRSFIAESFPEQDIEYDVNKICIGKIDIETTCENGFPNKDQPEEVITAITFYDNISKEYNLFTHTDIPEVEDQSTLFFDLSDPDQRDEERNKKLKIKHSLFDNEREMLMGFIKFWQSLYPDIITGWNNDLFDLPYTIARVAMILGEDWAKKFSPWGLVEFIEIEKFNKIETKVNIVGVEILDYLDVYKKFVLEPRPNYKLDTIAEIEIGQKKISYEEYGAMHLFYKKDFKKFAEYNIQDVVLINEIDEKRKLLDLAIFISYWSKINYSKIFTPVTCIESICYNHMLAKGIVFPPKKNNVKTRKNAGGYVKDPQTGKFKWVVSFDVASLYPSIMIQQNISPEKIIEGSFEQINIDEVLKSGYYNPSLRDKNYNICGNGWMFNNDSVGVIPEILTKLFDTRQHNRNQMLMISSSLTDKNLQYSEKKRLQREESKYDTRQLALKVLLNAFYGAFSNEGFVFFDMRLAEAVTLTGQWAIKHGQKTINDYLNKVLGTQNEDFVIAIDTDSLYITVDKLVEKVLPNETDIQKKVDFVDRVCKEKLAKLLTDAYDNFASQLNSKESKINMKREVIASAGLWTAKKRYALHMYDKEGSRYTEPKLYIKGLEVIKSTVLKVSKQALIDSVNKILEGTEEELINYVEEFRERFYNEPIENISFIRGAQDLEKHSLGSKGCPIHVSAALLYNKLLDDNEIAHIYPKIRSGDKIKYVYLKEQNPTRKHVIGFADNIPPQFNMEEYIDKDVMFDKGFLKPLEGIAKQIGWSVYPKPETLESLFC